MEQIPQSIYDFKKGDLITRIIPSKPIEVFGEETIVDRNFIGDALLFLGVANGCVYVEKDGVRPSKMDSGRMNDGGSAFLKMIFASDGPINLPLDAYDEGWSYFVDPYNIGEKGIHEFEETLDTLKKKLKAALAKEDYEAADKIKLKISKL